MFKFHDVSVNIQHLERAHRYTLSLVYVLSASFHQSREDPRRRVCPRNARLVSGLPLHLWQELILSAPSHSLISFMDGCLLTYVRWKTVSP